MSVTSDIGVSGDRLTRDEAFDLVRRAVAALARGEETIRASDLRRKAFEMLGRDSESLSERNFARILRDAHDSDVIDLRRRGDDFEVVPAALPRPWRISSTLPLPHTPYPRRRRPVADGRRVPDPRGLGVRGYGEAGRTCAWVHRRPSCSGRWHRRCREPSSTPARQNQRGCTRWTTLSSSPSAGDLVAPEAAAQAASRTKIRRLRRGAAGRRGEAEHDRNAARLRRPTEPGTKTKRGRTRAAKSTDE